VVSIIELWLPILLTAVFVFFASYIIHMFIGYHAADYRKVPSEDAVMDALRPFNLPPGDYTVPCPTGPTGINNPDFVARMKKGPVAIMTVRPTGEMAMGKQLGLWFGFSALVAVFAAYIASIALPRGAAYMDVFQVTSTVTFIGFGLAQWENSIWYNRSWATTFRNNVDALVYGLLAGGAFGWLWPG
jgi:hypothetical protein